MIAPHSKTMPTQSKWRKKPGCGSGASLGTCQRTTNKAMTAANTAGRKLDCQPNWSTKKPPKNGPTIPVAGPMELHVPRALPRSLSGNSSEIMAIQSGFTPAVPIPWITRPTISQAIESAQKHMSVPTKNNNTPMVKSRRLPSPSPNRP